MLFRARKLSWGLSANCQRGKRRRRRRKKRNLFPLSSRFVRREFGWKRRETIFQTFFSLSLFSGYTGKMTPAEKKKGELPTLLFILVRLDGWIPIVFAAGA